MIPRIQGPFGSARWLLVLAALLAGHADAATAPTASDVAYGSDAAQLLDVYAPDNAQQAPIIVMVHGGAWTTGDKDSRAVIANKAAHYGALGYLLVSVDYRLLPDADPLTQAQDVARALAYVQQHATAWGGDAKRVVLMGHSAGAHLVSLLSAAPALATAQGVQPWLATISLDSAALDVVAIMEAPHARLYDRAFGDDPAYWAQVSPQQQLQKAPVPMLLVCSSRRDDSCPEAQQFQARVLELGGRADLLSEDLSHRQINLTLCEDSAYTDSVDTFLRSLGLP